MCLAKRIIPSLAVLLCLTWSDVSGENPDGHATKEAAHTLEGTLKVHPKYLYRYYLSGLGNGQTCALYASEKFKDEKLKEIKEGSRIRVTGPLRTLHHSGGTEDNLSPFPEAWIIYMEVESVKVLAPPTKPAPQPGGGKEPLR